MPSSIARRMRSSSWVSAARIRTKASPFALRSRLASSRFAVRSASISRSNVPSIRARAASIRRPSSRVISTRTISNRSSRSWRSRDTVSAPWGTVTIARSGSSSRARSSDSSRQRSRTVGCPVSELLGDPASAGPTTSPASSDGEGVTTEGGGAEISVRGRRRGPSIPYHVRSALFSTGSTTSGRSAWISIASRTRALGDVPIATDRRTAGPPIQRPALRWSGAGPRAPDPKGAS